MISASLIAYSQNTDSLTISYKQANEITNGLINEGKLKLSYKALEKENQSLYNAYLKSENINISYKDTVVPTLKSIIINKEKEIDSHKNYTKNVELTLKRQKSKKWTWLGGGTLIGLIIGVVFAN